MNIVYIILLLVAIIVGIVLLVLICSNRYVSIHYFLMAIFQRKKETVDEKILRELEEEEEEEEYKANGITLINIDRLVYNYIDNRYIDTITSKLSLYKLYSYNKELLDIEDDDEEYETNTSVRLYRIRSCLICYNHIRDKYGSRMNNGDFYHIKCMLPIIMKFLFERYKLLIIYFGLPSNDLSLRITLWVKELCISKKIKVLYE